METFFLIQVPQSSSLFVPPLCDPFNGVCSLLGDGRTVTWRNHPAIASETHPEKETQSSWTSTLFKGAAISSLVLGAAYIGYRNGVLDGANSMFDTILAHLNKDARIPNTLPSSVEDAKNLFQGGVGRQITNLTSVSDWKSFFMTEVAENNAFVNMNVPAVNTSAIFETVTQPLTNLKDAASETASNAYYAAHDELAAALVGATVMSVSVLWQVTNCIRAARGI